MAGQCPLQHGEDLHSHVLVCYSTGKGARKAEEGQGAEASLPAETEMTWCAMAQKHPSTHPIQGKIW